MWNLGLNMYATVEDGGTHPVMVLSPENNAATNAPVWLKVLS